jgi:hypothetical protein
MPPFNANPNVKLIIDGLVVVFTDPKDEKCSIGVLGDVPEGHTLRIDVLEPGPDGELEIVKTIDQASVKDRLEIIVSGTSSSGITRRGMDAKIDRKKGADGNGDSFRWVVDFETDIYQKPIGAKKEGFASILTVNHGELLTDRISKNNLFIHHGSADREGTLFGRVATKTALDIVLDQPNSKAVFKNGEEVVFEADSNSRFQLLINRACSGNAGNDADAYYNAVGQNLRDEEKIFFSADELPPPAPQGGLGGPVDPDARCLNIRMSKSDPT